VNTTREYKIARAVLVSGMSCEEIGADLGVAGTRASQILWAVVKELDPSAYRRLQELPRGRRGWVIRNDYRDRLLERIEARMKKPDLPVPTMAPDGRERNLVLERNLRSTASEHTNNIEYCIAQVALLERYITEGWCKDLKRAVSTVENYRKQIG
jgi:hypothetical protein